MPSDNSDKFIPALYYFARFVLWALFKICFWFKTEGVRELPRDARGIIFAPNHASYLDPPVIGIAVRQPVLYLAKEYLFKVPIFGGFLYRIGVMPVKSEAEEFRTMRQVLRALKAGRSTVIFPEGTRTVDGRLKEPEGGLGFFALKAKTWVVPVWIDGTYEAMPRDVKMFRCRRVRAVFGRAFLPAEDPAILGAADPYLEVGRRAMKEIAAIRESKGKKI